MPPEELQGNGTFFLRSELNPETEFSVIFEDGIGPGRTIPLAVYRIGRGRQIAAIDRGTAGRVGDGEMVAEKLRQKFDIGRFTAATTRPGVFEQGPAKLGRFDVNYRFDGGLG